MLTPGEKSIKILKSFLQVLKRQMGNSQELKQMAKKISKNVFIVTKNTWRGNELRYFFIV